MALKLLGLAAFAATGSGLLFTVGLHETGPLNTVILMAVGYFFTLSLVDHYRELKEGE
jgi:drug/metabolite transporter (DMT)-like permease